MGDVDAGDAQTLLDAPDLAAHLHTQFGVEVAQRLVEEEHFGLHDQRTRQGDALLLSTAELVGLAVFQPA